MNIERELASIQRVEDVQPIENADAIEKIRVRDWWCVAKKGEFLRGDLCVYFEIDSLLPAIPQFDFLAKGSQVVTVPLDTGGEASGYRLKTVRLRGQISQGLALPLSSFGLSPYDTDIARAIGVHKWEAPISKAAMGFARGPFPSFIPRTDEERVQNMRAEINAHLGELCYITEKLDGTSLTMFRDNDGSLHVCSRNMDCKEGDNLYWEAARPYFDSLRDGIAVQGEVVGESVQSNPLKLKGRQLYAFNVYDFRSGSYVNFPDICAATSVPIVPIIEVSHELTDDIAGMIASADGPSSLNPSCAREGIIIRTVDQGPRRLSFKCISNSYLLKGDR